jgi:hypothetical protein
MKFEEWLSQQNGVIEVDCGCVTTEAFYHWMRAYEAGNSPVIPDGWACNDKANAALMMLDRLKRQTLMMTVSTALSALFVS